MTFFWLCGGATDSCVHGSQRHNSPVRPTQVIQVIKSSKVKNSSNTNPLTACRESWTTMTTWTTSMMKTLRMRPPRDEAKASPRLVSAPWGSLGQQKTKQTGSIRSSRLTSQLFNRVAVTRMARKSRRRQLQRRRRGISLMPATVSNVSLQPVSCMSARRERAFCFYLWKTRITQLPCMDLKDPIWHRNWNCRTSECPSPLFFFFFFFLCVYFLFLRCAPCAVCVL